MSTVFHNNRIDVINAGRRFAPQTREFLLQKYRSVRYRDAMHISLHEGEIWLFDYGVLICWGVSENDKQQLLGVLDEFIVDPLSRQEFEQYQFAIATDNQTDKSFRIHNDLLTLPSEQPLDRLAASHAFAQSAKLIGFEELAEQVIADNNYLSKHLAVTGRIPLSRRQLSKLRGLLFETRSDILLNFNLLDTPEFFWDYPELEPHYLIIAKYLDLIPRIELLNHKLETIHELVDMLASEQNHKHSSFLEWIIIILIAVEIVLSFIH